MVSKRDNFLDSKAVKWFTFIGTILVIILTLFQILEFFPKNPRLVIKPYEENQTLSFYIYNEGKEIALIEGYTICLFNQDKSACFKDSSEIKLGKPLEIHPSESKIVSMDYIVRDDRLDNWGIQICEKKLGCSIYIFEKAPLKDYSEDKSLSNTATAYITVMQKENSTS